MTTKTDTDKQLPTRCYTQSGNLLFKINIEICKKKCIKRAELKVSGLHLKFFV